MSLPALISIRGTARDIPEAPDGKTPNVVLESYVRSLEAVVKRYPRQWFNFYRFWS